MWGFWSPCSLQTCIRKSRFVSYCMGSRLFISNLIKEKVWLKMLKDFGPFCWKTGILQQSNFDISNFKVILFVFEALNGKAPDNISTLIHLKDPIRMTLKENLFFPKLALGKRAFCYLGPRYWNILPANIRLCTGIDKFKGLLKSYLLLNYHDFKTNLNAKRA